MTALCPSPTLLRQSYSPITIPTRERKSTWTSTSKDNNKMASSLTTPVRLSVTKPARARSSSFVENSNDTNPIFIWDHTKKAKSKNQTPHTTSVTQPTPDFDMEEKDLENTINLQLHIDNTLDDQSETDSTISPSSSDDVDSAEEEADSPITVVEVRPILKKNVSPKRPSRRVIWSDQQPGQVKCDWSKSTKLFYKFDAPKRCSYQNTRTSLCNLDVDDGPDDLSLRKINFNSPTLSELLRSPTSPRSFGSWTTTSFTSSYPGSDQFRKTCNVPTSPPSRFSSPFINHPKFNSGSHQQTEKERPIGASTPQFDRNCLPLPKDVPTLVYAHKVRVESVTLRSPHVFINIQVHNVDFHKEVVVRATSDGWKTSKDYVARYISSASPDRDNFFVSFPMPFSTDLQFCVKYETQGQTFWDNNQGKNYIVKGSI
eukprot:m.333603 g.333603  ORF g.333603 m.333603 type:complete len:429 (-) comp17182_c0_seq1:2222-3508(-)